MIGVKNIELNKKHERTTRIQIQVAQSANMKQITAKREQELRSVTFFTFQLYQFSLL